MVVFTGIAYPPALAPWTTRAATQLVTWATPAAMAAVVSIGGAVVMLKPPVQTAL
jgi:hypothetical protein